MAKIENTAQFGNVDSNLTEIIVQDLDITVVKKVDGEDSTYGYSGKEVTYTITATNNCDTDLRYIELYDVLDTGLTYVTNSFKVNGEQKTPYIQGLVIRYTIDTLEAGASVEFEFKATID